MASAKKSQYISFRVTDEELKAIEGVAAATGEKTRDWCRQVVLEKAGRERAMTKGERLLYEELSRVRYLVGHGFRLLLEGEGETAHAWEDARAMADHKAKEIADQLLARSRTFNHS